MDYAIEVNNLTKYYQDFCAVDNISFKVKKGTLFAFLGMNGAGKSTTINTICSILNATDGEILINGKELIANRDAIKHEIGVVFQNSVLDQSLTVLDNLKIRTSFYGLPKDVREKNIKEIIDILELEPILKKQIKNLSGGQKRRVDIARAMVHKPSLLILDEPTTGLDPKTRKMVWELVNKIREETGMTVFLTTHYLEEAEKAVDVIIMNHGRIIAEGSPVELKNKYSQDHLFVYIKKDANFEKELKSAKIPHSFDIERDCYDVIIEKGKDVKDIIKKFDKFITDFEVKKGTMEDVFLLVTGENFDGGEVND